MRKTPTKHRFSSAWILIAATAITAVGIYAMPAGADNSSSASPPQSTSPDIDNAMQIRAQFGFPSSRSDAEAAAADANSTTIWLKIPLRPSENSEMDRRMRILRSLAGLATNAENGSFPELGYASMDHQAGGNVIVGATADTPAVRAKIARAIPGTPFDVVRVPNSWARLKSLQTQIGNDHASLAANRVTVLNAVHQWTDDVVEVTYDTSNSRPDADAYLHQRYGAAGELRVVGAPNAAAGPGLVWSRTATSGPLLGGQQIYSPIHQCTATGAATRFDGYWTITAGHCGLDHSAWTQGPGGQSIGTNDVSSYYDNASTPCDCLAIHFLSAAMANNYILNAYTQLQAETANATASFYGPNVPVCYSGASQYTMGVRCGIMTGGAAPTTSDQGHTTTLTDQVQTNMITCPGDSGSPAISGVTWDGIVSGYLGSATGNCFNTMYFTKIIYIAGYSMTMLTSDP